MRFTVQTGRLDQNHKKIASIGRIRTHTYSITTVVWLLSHGVCAVCDKLKLIRLVYTFVRIVEAAGQG